MEWRKEEGLQGQMRSPRGSGSKASFQLVPGFAVAGPAVRTPQADAVTSLLASRPQSVDEGFPRTSTRLAGVVREACNKDDAMSCGGSIFLRQKCYSYIKTNTDVLAQNAKFTHQKEYNRRKIGSCSFPYYSESLSGEGWNALD